MTLEATKASELNHESDANQNTDAVIATWFDNQTGLMQVEATGKLQTPIDVTDSIVNVVLDATIGLHRSIDLIAAAPNLNSESEAISNDVRDAILAAIAAEQPTPITDLVPQPTQTRLGGVTCCTTPVIAATAAVTTAHRRKTVKMEYTRR